MSAAGADPAAPRFAISTGRGKNSSHATKLVNVDNVGGYVRGLAAVLQEKKPEVEGWWSVHQWERLHRSKRGWVASIGVAVDVDFLGPLDATGKETHIELPQDVFAKLSIAIETWPSNIVHFTPRGLRLIFVFASPVTDKDLVGAAMAGACDLVDAALKRSKLAARAKKNGKREIGLAVDGGASCDFARLFYDPGAIVGGVQRLAVVRVMDDEPTDPMTLAETPGHEREHWAEEFPEVEAFAPTSSPPKQGETSFERAVEDWNRAHPGDWPNSSGTCPICGHNGCFGQLPERPGHWSCFSSAHGDVGKPNADRTMMWGDALDIEADRRMKSRRDVLSEDSYLVDRTPHRFAEDDFLAAHADYRASLPSGITVAYEVEREPGDDDEPAPAKRLTMRERVLALGSVGPKLETEFSTLDAATRGGLRSGLNVIGGPPGGGKTGWGLNIGSRLAARGVPVTVLAADEAPAGLLIRLGQAAGFNRDKLEEGDKTTVEKFAASINEPSALDLLDGDATTVEEAADSLLARADGKLGVLIVDSIQTVRAGGTDGAEPRARVDAVVRALKSVARRGVCVVATSEVSRGFYRSRKPGEEINGLAAFKESGGVEFGCDLAMVMRSVEGQNGVADVEIVKNRLGKKEKFRLSLNFDTATFIEVSMPDEEEAAGPDPADTLAADMTRVRTALAEHPDGVRGLSEVFLFVRGIDNARKTKATQALMATGEIRVADGRPKNRPLWFWQPPTDAV